MNIGFIGAGNMANAMIRIICSNKRADPENIYVSNPSKEKLDLLNNDLGVNVSTDNKKVASKADILFLSVKPQKLDEVLSEIKSVIPQSSLVVSIAAGKTLEFISERLLPETEIVRVMPNVAALTGDGISAVSPNCFAERDPEKLGTLLDILNSIGQAEIVNESLIDIVAQIAGASPAWIAMVIEAIADGAVHEGMPRDLAYKFATAGIAGTGAMMAKTGSHPGIIKDMVSSPNGTTIEGIKVLEERGVRSAFIDAVIASTKKARNI